MAFDLSDRPWFRSCRTQLHTAAAGWMLSTCLLSLTLPGVAQAQQVRPGLWEFDGQQMRLQRGAQSLDMQRIQQQMETQMRGMNADSRHMLEENLRSSGIPMPKGRNVRVCVPPEQANLPRLAERQQQDGCQFNLLEKGADFVRGQLRCSEPESTGSLLSTLITPERIHNRAELKTPQGKLIINSSAQWQGSDCGDTPLLGAPNLQDRSLLGSTSR